MQEEIWKDIPGYEGYYQASSNGEIKSIKRTIQKTRSEYRIKERILKLTLNYNGYLRVNLNKKGKAKLHYVHILVARTFLGKRPKDHDVDHINNNRQDNSIKNLQWLHYKENRGIPGNKNMLNPDGTPKNSKLTKDQVIYIRKSSKSAKDLALMFDVSSRTIYNIINRDIWIGV